jgi:thiamine pyrophosphokinase
MNRRIVESATGVTLVAAGPVAARDLAAALARAPLRVAADGGADRARALGHAPAAVIGDLDSLKGPVPADRLFPIREQETTDFDKALRSIAAPFVLALGILGGRLDHELAALSTLVSRRAMPCLAVGRHDVVFAAPPRLTLALRPGDRLSLYPLLPVTGRSQGLVWPIDGLDFAPDRRIGTSNRVEHGPVALAFDAPGMIVALPRARLDAALAALIPAPPAARGG